MPVAAAIHLSLLLDPQTPAVLPDAVTFETGATLAQVRDPATFAYNHHGEGFGDASPGALTAFYEDLILGRPMPVKFAARGIAGMDTLVAMVLFLHRDLAVLPRTPGFVASIDLMHRRGLTVIGHVDHDLEHLVYLLNDVPSAPDGWLESCLSALAHYLRTGLPPSPPRVAGVRVIERGTDGFVFATTTEATLLKSWVELYRQGHLRGLVLGADVEGRRAVLASRKSPYVAFDLLRAASVLNEMEAALGERGRWAVDGLWLEGPPRGTRILPEDLLRVFTRV